MTTLHFPCGRIVGAVEYSDSWMEAAGPILASGDVLVPDTAEVSLKLEMLEGCRRASDGVWNLVPSGAPVDLAFLRDLPSDVVRSVTVGPIRNGDDAR